MYRFKPEMWAKVAEEMAVPWRAAEAMHWQLGEADMARRAGVVPFSLSNVGLDAPSSGHRPSPNRGHSHSQSHGSTSTVAGAGNSRYSRPSSATQGPTGATRGSGTPSTRSIAARRDDVPRSIPPSDSGEGLALAAIGAGMPPGMGRGSQYLPSVAEMTTGVSPYTTPAYSMSMSMPMGGGHSSPGPMLPSLGMAGLRPEGKRRASPDMGQRESSRRRQ